MLCEYSNLNIAISLGLQKLINAASIFVKEHFILFNLNISVLINYMSTNNRRKYGTPVIL